MTPRYYYILYMYMYIYVYVLYIMYVYYVLHVHIHMCIMHKKTDHALFFSFIIFIYKSYKLDVRSKFLTNPFQSASNLHFSLFFYCNHYIVMCM